MSKIGKRPIPIKENVTISQKKGQVVVKGPKGEIRYSLPRAIKLEETDGQLWVRPQNNSRETAALWGLWRSLLANAVAGVTEGFRKELEMVGVGYKVQKKGDNLELDVGYSHSVVYPIPEGVTVEIDQGVIRVEGIDKQKVGQVAAEIRAVRPPEPYKGKGIRYVGEHVKLKPGKAAKAATGAA